VGQLSAIAQEKESTGSKATARHVTRKDPHASQEDTWKPAVEEESGVREEKNGRAHGW